MLQEIEILGNNSKLPQTQSKDNDHKILIESDKLIHIYLHQYYNIVLFN